VISSWFCESVGADAVLGHVTGGRDSVPKEQGIRRMKHSPGSGVLSVSVVPDGPTRILRVVDENKKVSLDRLVTTMKISILRAGAQNVYLIFLLIV
jgi:hypothetical protein